MPNSHAARTLGGRTSICGADLRLCQLRERNRSATARSRRKNAAGCRGRNREGQTRTRGSGKELNRAADRAVEDARAAAEGIREGWSKGDDGRERLNLNAASESDLLTLPGITKSEARLIIEDRPYGDKHDLVTKRIITEDEYLKIRDQIVAK